MTKDFLKKLPSVPEATAQLQEYRETWSEKASFYECIFEVLRERGTIRSSNKIAEILLFLQFDQPHFSQITFCGFHKMLY